MSSCPDLQDEKASDAGAVMIMSKKLQKQLHAESSGSAPPKAPEGAGLPDTYKVKRCFYCKVWSCSAAPWNLLDTPLKAWHPVVPWGKGSKLKPQSDICKPCVIATDSVIESSSQHESFDK